MNLVAGARRVMRRSSLALLGLSVGCVGDPSNVIVELSPSVISSLDGTTTVSAIVTDGKTPLEDVGVHLSVTYEDRNGVPHAVDPVDGSTDARGVFHATLVGLTFDGAGTVIVETSGVDGAASFAVLDRTPPKVEILPPTTDNRVGPGLPLDIQVRITDEIGVSKVTLDGTGAIQNARTTIVTSGAAETTLTFRTSIEAGAAPGPTIELHALARDLSGNVGVAPPLTLTVDPAISIATPPGLVGTLLVDGTAQQIADPRAVTLSAQDGHLYVADRAQTGACNPSCIWRVDATTGAIDPTPIVVGIGDIEGIAVDATSDNLYFTDRANRTGRLTWNGTGYANPVGCSDANQQRPQEPFHLVFDGTLGLLVADNNLKDVIRVATCASTSVGTTFSLNGNFDDPRGIAIGAAGELYVSDFNRDEISRVDRTTGVVTSFAREIQEPYGIEWTGSGATVWANSLMVASFGDRIVESTTGLASTSAAFLRNSPVDLTLAGGTMYVLTGPGFGNRGRIYKVTGF